MALTDTTNYALIKQAIASSRPLTPEEVTAIRARMDADPAMRGFKDGAGHWKPAGELLPLLNDRYGVVRTVTTEARAVDRLGPFQKMDGAMGPGTMLMDGTTSQATNGQGDPSNVPNALARSDAFHVACTPRTLTGAQAFFDTFRGEKPLVETPAASIDAAVWTANRENVTQFENDKWTIRNYQGDFLNSKVFFMGGHFMDTLYDGGTARQTPVIHNNNASLVMMPKATADISGGKVLHVTMEVDAHFDGRRWCDVYVAAAGDPLVTPGKFADDGWLPTVSGNLFRWEIHSNTHGAALFWPSGDPAKPLGGVDVMQGANFNDGQSFERDGWEGTPELNGTPQNLDRRHRFDLYLSKTHFRIVETTEDGVAHVVRDKEFPAGAALPFDKCQVYFVHQLYHTGNDRPEILTYGGTNFQYWYNYRPYVDERHWDNMGQEVLPGFPAIVRN